MSKRRVMLLAPCAECPPEHLRVVSNPTPGACGYCLFVEIPPNDQSPPAFPRRRPQVAAAKLERETTVQCAKRFAALGKPRMGTASSNRGFFMTCSPWVLGPGSWVLEMICVFLQCDTPSLANTFKAIIHKIFRSNRNEYRRRYSTSSCTFCGIDNSSLPLTCTHPVTPSTSS